MKKIPISTALLFLAFAGPASAQADVAAFGVTKGDVVTKEIRGCASAAASQVKRMAPGVTSTSTNGIKKFNAIGLDQNARVVPLRRGAFSKAAPSLPEGYALFEGFEGWNGEDTFWVPEGWSVESNGKVDASESWRPAQPLSQYPSAPEGHYYYHITYADDFQDEWLISPYCIPAEGMELSFMLYLYPLYLFKMDNVNWDSYEYEGVPEVAATLQVWVQPKGGEWTKLHDFADDYRDYSFSDLAALYPMELSRETIDLEGYYGKEVRLGFRLVGEDGNTMFVDAIAVGYPRLDDVSYSSPIDTQYWGPALNDADITQLNTALALYPVNVPITWINESSSSKATYTWSYTDPVNYGRVTSSDSDELSVTYHPNYSTEATTANNLIAPPTLLAEAPQTVPGEFTAPYAFFQAGGKAESTLKDGTDFKASLLPFNTAEMGLGRLTVFDDVIGDMAIPVFGHNVNSDRYWLNYSLNGETPNPGDYSRLEGIANLIMPTTEAPLVVNGVNVYGYGDIAADAELTATIYGLNSEMSSDISTFTVIASAKVKGADILLEDPYGKCLMCLPFTFDKPAVIKATDEHPAYFVMFEGFNSDRVEYFVPFQSIEPYPNYMCLGYILNHIDLESQTGRPAYYNLKSMRYVEDGEYVDCYGAFAIGLDAEYPWLTTDCEAIALPSDGSSVEIALSSYYDGKDLVLDTPTGIKAAIMGRFDKCVLSVQLDGNALSVDGNIIVSAPGLEIAIPVSGSLGSQDIIVDYENGAVLYDLHGRPVDRATVQPGIYVGRNSDGSACKVQVK